MNGGMKNVRKSSKKKRSKKKMATNEDKNNLENIY